MRLCKQLSTGTPIVTPSAGDIAADTVHAASPASLARQYPRDFPDEPLRDIEEIQHVFAPDWATKLRPGA